MPAAARLASRIFKQLFPFCLVFFLGYNFGLYNSSSHQRLARLEEFNPEPSQSVYQLVILVISAPGNREARNTIRKTWLDVDADTRRSVRAVFAVGTEGLERRLGDEVEAEQRQHRDLLLLPLTDSYGALTRKVLQSFVRVHKDYRFRYLLKCDDDTFVNVAAIVKELQKEPVHNSLYWGFFDGRAPVLRVGQWAEPGYKLCDRYIPYALGGGYVLSYGLVEHLSRSQHRLHIYNNEDTSVGAWLAGLRVERRHDVRFDTEWKSRGCSDKFIVTHKQVPGEMRNKWKRLQHSGNICDGVETKVRLSYNYDWSKRPSECCARVDHSLP